MKTAKINSTRIKKCLGRIDDWNNSGSPLQCTQANTASLLLQAGNCSAGAPPVKQHIGTQWCEHVQYMAQARDRRTDGQGVTSGC